MKTTKKHFEIFKSECEKWIEVFGLKDWEFRVFWDKNIPRGDLGTLTTNTLNRCATIGFCKDWTDNKSYALCDEEIKLIAFHEMAHVFIRGLSFIAESRFINDGEIDAAEHKIVRTLENVLYPKY